MSEDWEGNSESEGEGIEDDPLGGADDSGVDELSKLGATDETSLSELMGPNPYKRMRTS